MSTSAGPTDSPHSLFLILSPSFSLSLFLCVFVCGSCCLPMVALQSTQARTKVCYSLVGRECNRKRGTVGERENNIRNGLVHLLHKCQGPNSWHIKWVSFPYFCWCCCCLAAIVAVIVRCQLAAAIALHLQSLFNISARTLAYLLCFPPPRGALQQ